MIISIITAIVIWQTHHVVVRPWVIGATAIVWVASNALLRAKQDSLGTEREYIDWWSIPHFMTGVLFGVFGVPLAYVVAIAIVWEIVEIFAHADEYPTNRIMDLLLAALGWAIAMALGGGDFALV